MKYWIDFSSWAIEAENETAAHNRVRQLMEENAKSLIFPTVSSIQKCEENYKEEIIETE